MDKIIKCPYCGGGAKEYHKPLIKIIHPLLFLDKKYYCKKCDEHFSTPLQEWQKPKPLEINKVDILIKKFINALGILGKIILIIFLIWTIVTVIIVIVSLS